MVFTNEEVVAIDAWAAELKVMPGDLVNCIVKGTLIKLGKIAMPENPEPVLRMFINS
jgi:hypothetical protein